MDKDTRNRIQRATQAARAVLEREYAEQLGGVFDIRSDGKIAPAPGNHLDAEQRILRAKLVAVVEHLRASGLKPAEAVASHLREAAFTTLNRFVALKMLEARDLLQECVSRGDQSTGFKEFTGLAPGLIQVSDHGYRLYIESIFDEIGREVRVLFNRRDPAGLLWPRRQALSDLLDIYNASDLAEVWKEDETIGWVYQFFNAREEREEMRRASRSPRDTRELAVRNQFFTPRYVVMFLTDNTLGRIWYEMRKGDTALTNDCRFLVRRPREVFLLPGQIFPDTAGEPPDRSQEEALARPVYIQHRPKKDPRDLRILDPACGSGHFLLYAFDVLERIYQEAWQDQESPAREKSGRTLREDFDSLDELRRSLPQLIVEHNLHGVDVDPRAAQIAAFALWLRAQRAWSDMGLRIAARPDIRRSNVVIAEPMPGEDDMRREFTESVRPRVLGQLLDVVFAKMKLAGVAGSLLAIEEEISDSVATAKRQWLDGPIPEQQLLFGGLTNDRQGQEALQFDVQDVTDETFWEHAEGRILEALAEYSERTEHVDSLRRRLFSEDARHGFAFIEICRQRYDVVLMNPPFGELAKGSEEYVESSFPSSKGNVLAHFLDRAAMWTTALGKTGAIVSRTCFYLTSLDRFRANVLGRRQHLVLFADLGSGVLDAMVETAAAVFDRTRPLDKNATFFRLLTVERKDEGLAACTRKLCGGEPSMLVFLTPPESFDALVGRPYVYWITPKVIARLSTHATLDPAGCDIRVGLQTGDDQRFLRLWHEVEPAECVSCSGGVNALTLQRQCIRQTTEGKKWVWYSKIDAASPFVASIHLMVNWANDGAEIKAYHEARGVSASKYVMSESHYFRPGISYMLRSSRLVPYIVPKGIIPTAGRSQIYPREGKESWVLSLAASNLASAVARFKGENFAQPKFQNSMVGSVPYMDPPVELFDALEAAMRQIMDVRRDVFSCDETCIEFNSLPVGLSFPNSGRWERATLIGADLDLRVGHAFGFSEADMVVLQRDLMDSVVSPAWGTSSSQIEDASDVEEEIPEESRANHRLAHLISYGVGCVFGRWDARTARGTSHVPSSPDPFDPLPTCPIGQLRNARGLPADVGDVPTSYPISIAWDGILVDDPSHPSDIERRVLEAIGVVWEDQADDIEHDVCESSGVKSIREYCRKPAGFFADHLRHYSRSRRQAPIYWPLSTASSSYTIWLYYHRFNRDTFFKVLHDYVAPKLQHEEGSLVALAHGSRGGSSASQRAEVAVQEQFVEELRALRDEIVRIAPLWKPSLSDGVLVNFAPLWRLVPQHRAWQKECKECWGHLVAGDYDWAHLAMYLWPERVVPKCANDRSLAVAHGLDDVFWIEDTGAKWRARRVDDSTLEVLIAQRSSPAVKDALKSLLGAPAPSSGRGGTKRSATPRRAVAAPRSPRTGGQS